VSHTQLTRLPAECWHFYSTQFSASVCACVCVCVRILLHSHGYMMNIIARNQVAIIVSRQKNRKRFLHSRRHERFPFAFPKPTISRFPLQRKAEAPKKRVVSYKNPIGAKSQRCIEFVSFFLQGNLFLAATRQKNQSMMSAACVCVWVVALSCKDLPQGFKLIKALICRTYDMEIALHFPSLAYAAAAACCVASSFCCSVVVVVVVARPPKKKRIAGVRLPCFVVDIFVVLYLFFHPPCCCCLLLACSLACCCCCCCVSFFIIRFVPATTTTMLTTTSTTQQQHKKRKEKEKQKRKIPVGKFSQARAVVCFGCRSGTARKIRLFQQAESCVIAVASVVVRAAYSDALLEYHWIVQPSKVHKGEVFPSTKDNNKNITRVCACVCVSECRAVIVQVEGIFRAQRSNFSVGKFWRGNKFALTKQIVNCEIKWKCSSHVGIKCRWVISVWWSFKPSRVLRFPYSRVSCKCQCPWHVIVVCFFVCCKFSGENKTIFFRSVRSFCFLPAAAAACFDNTVMKIVVVVVLKLWIWFFWRHVWPFIKFSCCLFFLFHFPRVVVQKKGIPSLFQIPSAADVVVVVIQINFWASIISAL